MTDMANLLRQIVESHQAKKGNPPRVRNGTPLSITIDGNEIGNEKSWLAEIAGLSIGCRLN